MRSACVIIFALLATVAFGQSPAQKTVSTPQLEFTAENPTVPHPVVVPDSVFAVLAQDSALQCATEKCGQPSRDWFSAEKLRSPSSGDQLYMVEAGGPLVGANIDTFWLIRNSTRMHRAVILWKFGAHNVTLRYQPGAAYPVISATGLSAVHIWTSRFHYRNGKYVQIHSDDKDIR